MKKLNQLTLLAALVAGLATFPALGAEDAPVTPTPPETPTTPVTPTPPETPTTPVTPTPPETPTTPVTPTPPETPTTPVTPTPPETPTTPVTPTPPETPTTPVTPGKPGKPEKPAIDNSNRGGHSKLDNVRMPERFQDDAELQKLVAAAKTQREAFVAQQQELAKQLKGSTAEVKDELKAKLKLSRETFLEETKELRTNIRERVKELVAELKVGNIKDGATEGGGRGRRGGN